jgi:hypothetical protein
MNDHMIQSLLDWKALTGGIDGTSHSVGEVDKKIQREETSCVK